MEHSGADQSALAAGNEDLRHGRWREARTHFEQVVEECATEPAAWEGLSWAAWWLEDPPGCLRAREGAYRAYRQAGDQRGAARMALWLSDDHVEFYGASAVAEGWSQRAARLLADLPQCPEHGWLDVFRANTLAHRDPAEARRLAARARELGRQLGVVDLEMFSLATEGVAMAAGGEVAEGMRCLDEAAVAALAGDYETLAPAAWTCCHLISTCELTRDYERAAQWCQQVGEFSRRLQARFVTGVCRAHYAAVLTWHGQWQEAERELVAAVATLSANRPAWAPEAVVRLGELRRRQGRAEAAEELFGQAPEHPLALLGTAQLGLDRGEPGVARDLLLRQLRRVPASDLAGRAGAVELLVRVELARGDREAAAAHLAELRSIAAGLPALPLRAALQLSEGLVAAASGDHETACNHLADGAALFGQAGAPLELGHCRLELARVQAAMRRPDHASREARAARQQFAELGAEHLVAQASEALDRTGDEPSAQPAAEAPAARLTSRQLEVLRLVAEGLGDKAIAARLVLSEHTVHRHIANIYARMGCSSRATAVAQAGKLGLL